MNGVYDVVIPTIGRPSLLALLRSLEAADGPLPRNVIVVDDRRDRSQALPCGPFVPGTDFSRRIVVIAGAARGPA
ncbi:MAG: transferase, partial [Candidatus Eremiobacteraeota bacterium]|nr:transferase [Candidatus Eremiobacteraeota bacterium]